MSVCVANFYDTNLLGKRTCLGNLILKHFQDPGIISRSTSTKGIQIETCYPHFMSVLKQTMQVMK